LLVKEHYFPIVNISLHPYRLEFVFPFRTAHGVRTHTDAVFVELECDGVRAFGEATLPPYLPYTQASTVEYLSAIDLSQFNHSFRYDLGTRSYQIGSQGHRATCFGSTGYGAVDTGV
jgi:L-alanine-DL-glutamate epimerase-like enolase superfamily enzyme